jgi:methylmalonyl-CoA mutase C-terminal domain/subunit
MAHAPKPISLTNKSVLPNFRYRIPVKGQDILNMPPLSLLLINIFFMSRPIRVLVAKVGLDGHDRGAKIIAAALRDAGMEVIYTGLRQTPDMVVNAALQEDVDAIGVSILSGAHLTVFPRIKHLMDEKGMNDVLLTGGGIIPDEDMHTLNSLGVGKLFPPGTDTHAISHYISDWVKEHRSF